MNGTYDQNSILQEHCYFTTTSQSCNDNNGFYQKSLSNQSVSKDLKTATPLSINSLFQCHHTSHVSTPSSYWNWRNEPDDHVVNLVGAVEEVPENDSENFSTAIISDTPVICDEDPYNSSDGPCDYVNPSGALLQHLDSKLDNIDHYVSPIQHEHELRSVIQCQSGIQNTEDRPKACIRSTQTDKEGSSLNCEVRAPFILSHITLNNVKDHSTLSPQVPFGPSNLDHPNNSEKYMATFSSSVGSISFQEHVLSAVEKQGTNTRNTDSERDMPECHRNAASGNITTTTSPCPDPIDVLSVPSDVESELLHLRSVESSQCHNTITDNVSMNKFRDIDHILEPPLCHVSKRSDTTDSESSVSNHELMSSMNLRLHKIDISPKQGFFCQICRKLCSTVSILKHHIQHCHSPHDLATLPALYQEVKCSSCKVEYFMCLYCCRRYFSIKRIITHSEGHRTRSCFRCVVCTVKFFMSTRWHLLDHCIKPCCAICQPNSIALLEQLDSQNCSSDINDLEMTFEPSQNVKESEEFMIENVTNWDPVVLLHHLPLNVVEVGGAIVSNGGGDQPNLLTSNYRKRAQSNSMHGELNSGNDGGDNLISEVPMIDHETKAPSQTTSSYGTDMRLEQRGIFSSVNAEGDATLQKRFKCQHCGELFLQENKYLAHIEIQHGYGIDHPNKPYQCHICEDKFAYRRGLQVHVKGHYMKILRCDYCKKIFSHKRYFAVHRCVKM